MVAALRHILRKRDVNAHFGRGVMVIACILIARPLQAVSHSTQFDDRCRGLASRMTGMLCSLASLTGNRGSNLVN
jgi:hypothetical protein